MSASSYAACPRCTARTKKKIEALTAEAQASYGVIPADAYAAMVAEAAKDTALIGNVQAFREDYEIHGAQRGTVTVDYLGTCENCGLSVSFTYEHEIPGVNE